MKDKEKIIVNEISKILKVKLSKKNYNMKIGEIKNWDSFNHIKIYVVLSKKFKYKGDTKSLYKVRYIKDWIDYFK